MASLYYCISVCDLSPHSWSSLAMGVSLDTPTTSATLVICTEEELTSYYITELIFASFGSNSISFFFFQNGPFMMSVCKEFSQISYV